MHPFRKAVEERDEAAMAALLADDVVFTSPVAFNPYAGKPITAAILRGVLRVFEDFRYVREIHDSAGGNHALEFETGIAGQQKWVESNVRRLANEGEGTFYNGYWQDITARKEAEAELASANRVAFLAQLSASIAEINQPISAVVMNAEAALRLLLTQPTDTEAVRQLLACIVKDAMRTGDIVSRTRALIEKAPPWIET